MDALRQSINRTVLGIANLVTPVLKESRFREEGVITPAEFVAAGDHLVHQCPTWHWASGEKNYIQSYLPENKQYLCTKGVPCHKRFSQMFKVKGDENRVLEETDNDGGWIDAGFVETGRNLVYFGESISLDDNSADNDYDQFKSENVIKGIEAIDISESKSGDNGLNDDEEPEDFDAFMQENMDDEEDDLIVQRVTPQPTSFTDAQASESDVLQTRTYDLYITYDKFYRTARFWLTGFDEHNKPLSASQMFEDFRQVSLLFLSITSYYFHDKGGYVGVLNALSSSSIGLTFLARHLTFRSEKSPLFAISSFKTNQPYIYSYITITGVFFFPFSQDHANKTITMEMHPHFTGVSMPSIHPCRQAELMKRLMDKIAGSSENNSSETTRPGTVVSSIGAQNETPVGASNTESQQKRQLGVHQYLVVFLKFVQSVIPTIDYDFTRNFKF
ncbi:unnamed protein product [Rodentolepis nana]|uniref:Ubiquitin-like-conjugating enzyme ATG3 n=1 Tax=Rodentolepis nana TaxID=102285 RepID=A0A0R3TZ38_RODNA|nr:unnamed protein product [Rodentolepis nana]